MSIILFDRARHNKSCEFKFFPIRSTMHNNISPCETCDNGIPPAIEKWNLENQARERACSSCASCIIQIIRAVEHRASFRNSSSWKKISRKTRFRAAELKIPIRFQSRLSFLDPLFVFPAIFLRVPRGGGGFSPIFLKDFPPDRTILVTAHRTETTFIRRKHDTVFQCNFLVPFFPSIYPSIYISLPSVFSSNAFLTIKGNISKSVSGTVPKFQFNLLHRSFVCFFFSLSLSPSKDFSLDWTHSSRCTVRRNNVYAVSKWVSRF